jgi:hypothetical protein
MGSSIISSKVDPDVWLRPARKPSVEKYYEYALCYVDDGPPTVYLEAQLSKMADASGTQSSDKYVEESFKTVEESLRSKNEIVALKNCIELTIRV